MSDRYKAINALMDDPENLACICREFYRRWGEWPSVSALVVRPWTGPDLRALDMKLLAEISQPLKDIWVIVHGEEEMELGPFPDLNSARDAAEEVLKSEGLALYFLQDLPWTKEDDREFPLSIQRKN
jgi:hypothetical protein